MRKIKFRAWHLVAKEMCDIYSIDFVNELLYLNSDVPTKFEHVVLMQCTSLKDKNGKEIYEGDIVDFNGKFVVITWNHGEAMFWGGNNTQRYIFQYCDMLKVVGNIYENPKLLKDVLTIKTKKSCSTRTFKQFYFI